MDKIQHTTLRYTAINNKLWIFSETVASHMCINTHELSRYEAKPSKQLSIATPSFTKVFLKNTNDSLF